MSKRGYKSVVFEADLMFDMTSQTTNYQMMFENMAGSRAYMFNIELSSSGIDIYDSSSTSGTNSDRHTNLVKSGAAKNGEWFNLRVEYYVGGRDELRIHTYINGELVFVSDNFYGFYKDQDPNPTNAIDRVRLYSLNAADGKLYVDNYSLVQSSDENPNPDLKVGAQ